MSTTPHAPQPARPRSRWRLVAVAIISSSAAALVIAAALLRLHGVEWFVVLTPSMGEAAPVGTLVLTEPTTVHQLHLGDIVSYRPEHAKSGPVFTHRIVELHASTDTASARGDINAAADPLPVTDNNLVGRVWIRIPAIGWLLRVLPLSALGLAILWILTLPLRSPIWRRTIRNLGASVIASACLSVFRPLTNTETITTAAVPHGLLARVVSTGLLPITIDGRGGSVQLTTGAVRDVLLIRTTIPGHRPVYTVPIHLDLPPAAWVAMIVLCAIPLLVGVVDGLRHPDPTSAPAAV